MKRLFKIKIFDNKIFVLLFSVICATILWYTISVSNGSEEVRVIKDVPINFNMEDIKQLYGLEMVEIVYPESLKGGTVDVRVKAKRGILAAIKAEDIVVTAQTTNITSPKEYNLTLKYETKNTYLDFSFEGDNTKEVRVSFDRMSTKNVKVEADIQGIVVQTDFIMETPYTNIDSVDIYGPESIVQNVDSVAISAVTNEVLRETKEYDGTLVMYDVNKNVVTSPHLTVLGENSYRIIVPVKMTKTLNLEISLNNVPNYYILTSDSNNSINYTISPSEVKVKGSSEDILSNFPTNAYNIGSIDFTTLTPQSNTVIIPLSFGGAIETVSDVKEVEVTFDIENMSSRTISVEMENAQVNIENVNEGYEVEVRSERINNVTVYGPASELEKLEDYEFIVTVDASSQKNSGNSIASAVISIRNNSKCWIYGDYEIQVSTKPTS